MQIESADTLIHSLRDSGLFTAEQLLALVRELAPVGDNPAALMRHLVHRDRITVYQLRKVVHGKAAELFFGDYVVLDKLGEGGMGKVYKARQNRLGRDVALKIVRSSLLSNPLVRRRYEREVQAASQLQHPHIVSVFDAGEVGGRYYLAMEFVDGIDLSRLIREHGILPVPEACEYARQAALGMQHAHDRGFVHRDIKPSNIIVSGERHVPQATEPAFVKILDMGLVREVGFDEATELTRDGTVVGTPDYMAPEQAKNSSTVDHRADLYSLGCAITFLLTGRPPFPDGSAIEKLLRHQIDPPPPLRESRSDVPEALAAIVSKLLAKKASDRYPNARDVAAALEPFCGYPGGSPPVSFRSRRAAAPAAPETPLSARSTVPPALVDTPRPKNRPRPPKAKPEPSPFAFPLEPPSGPYHATPARSGANKPAARPAPRSTSTVLVAVVVAVVLVLGVVGVAMLGGSGAKGPTPTKSAR